MSHLLSETMGHFPWLSFVYSTEWTNHLLKREPFTLFMFLTAAAEMSTTNPSVCQPQINLKEEEEEGENEEEKNCCRHRQRNVRMHLGWAF